MSERDEKRSPKRKLRGGMDPSEMAKLSWEKRRQRAKEAAGKPSKDVDPRAVLEELASGKYPPYVRQQAARYLDGAGEKPSEETDWRRSVQVRPDFEPPGWREVLLVAKAAGAFEVGKEPQ